MATLGDFNRVVILLALIALTNSGASNDSFTKVCEDGWYGTSCKLSCGSCLGDQPCNKVTGNCAACKPRRKPPLCQEDVRSADTDKKLQCCVYETMAITAVILCFIFIIVFIRATRTRDTISIYTLNSFDTEPLIDTQMTKV